MSTLQFPKNPSINDEYDWEGFKYVYDGQKWKTIGVGYNPVNDLKDKLEPRIDELEDDVTQLQSGNSSLVQAVNSLSARVTAEEKDTKDWEGFTAELLAQGGVPDNGQPDELGNSKRVDALQKIHGAHGTVSSLASGAHPVGSYVTLSDRSSGVFLVKSGGVPTGGRVLDAGNGNTAELQITNHTFIEHWGAKGDWDTNLKTGTDNYQVFDEIISYIATLPSGAGWVAGMMEAEGLRVSAGRGTFGVSQTVDCGSVSVTLDFAGTMQTIFEAMPSFAANTPIFRLGSKSVQKLTKSSTLQNCSLNCGAITGVRGVEIYGLRDSSRISDILITGFTETAFYSDFAGQTGGAFMSQGVIIDNVHAVSFAHAGGVIFDIGGLFESTISAGKALLNSATTSITADIVGYRIGRTECRGVHITGCSSGNFFGSGYNAGLVYENATRCWDTQNTYEGINGPNVEFGKTQACSICYSDAARHYNPNPAAAPNNKQYTFRSANACGSHSINASASSESISFEAGSVNCCSTIDSINGTVTQVRANVIKFNGGSGNVSQGYASTDGAIFSLTSGTTSGEGFGNGALEKHDQFWSSFFLAAGGYRFRRGSDSTEVFTIVNGTPVANGTSMKLLVNNGTTITLKDVSVGAADSATAGFRSLRVTN